MDKNPNSKIDGYVYLIHLPDMSRFYIGSTNNTRQRFKNHLTNLRCGKHHSQRLQRVYNKYSEGSINFSIIAECVTRKDAENIEQLLINHSFGNDECLNVSSNAAMAAQCPIVIQKRNSTLKSSQHRKSASEKNKEWFKNNPEKALLMHSKSAETRRNSAEFRKNNSEMGKKRNQSVEAKKIFSERMAKYRRSIDIQPNSKPVVRISADGSETHFISASEAVRRTAGSHLNSISRCCLGKGKTASGYRWRFA